MRMTSVAAAALAVAISAFPAAQQASAQPAADTMGAIKERGYLLCGVAGNNVGFSLPDSQGVMKASIPIPAAPSPRPSWAMRTRSASSTPPPPTASPPCNRASSMC